MMDKAWTAEEINEMVRQFHVPCVVAAAAELDLFGLLADAPFTAADAAQKLQADPRGLTILLDALAGLHLLEKQQERYQVPAAVARVLSSGQPGNQLAMVQHQANCLRRWAQLAAVVKTGRPPACQPSIRGQSGDYASFIEAMDNVSGPVAGPLVAELLPLSFRHLLDVGGGSGTWTIAFLRALPTARATLFDLPQVMSQARERLRQAGVEERVTLVSGDFYVDPLPAGADLAWVSAIVHQNSRAEPATVLPSLCSLDRRRTDPHSGHSHGQHANNAFVGRLVCSEHVGGYGERRHIHV